MHWYGWIVTRKVANLLCPAFWTLSGKVLKKRREKRSFPWNQLTIPSQGKLLYGQEDMAGRHRHSKPGSLHTGDPWESRQQVNRQATDVRKMTGFSEALSGDLVIFALTQENRDNCPVGKQNWERPLCKDGIDTFDFKPLTFTNHQADVFLSYTSWLT